MLKAFYMWFNFFYYKIIKSRCQEEGEKDLSVSRTNDIYLPLNSFRELNNV